MRITALNDREKLGTTTTRYLLLSRDIIMNEPKHAISPDQTGDERRTFKKKKNLLELFITQRSL